MAIALASLSMAVPWRKAATSPSANPRPNARTEEATARTRLFVSASRTSSMTGRRVAMDRPRSPWATRPSHRAYCTGSGASKPYARLTASISAWLASPGMTAAIGSPGARWTIANTMTLAPSKVGTASRNRRATNAHIFLARHAHRREVDEPGLRLHEPLHLRRERARIEIVGHEDPRRVVDEDLVRPRQDGVLLLQIKRPLGLLDQLVHLGVDVRHRVHRDGHDGLRVEEPAEAAPRLEEVPGDVPRVEPFVVRRLEAGAPAGQQRVPLHGLEVDVEPHVAEILLDELVHRERQHLARARGGDEVHGLRGRLAVTVARLLEQRLGLGRVVRVGLLRVAEPRVALVRNARRRDARVVQEVLADADPIDGVVGGLAHELVVPRLLVEPQRVRPVVRIRVQRDLEARRLELGDRVGRRHLDPVHLPAPQRREPRRELRHREEDQLVGLRPALGVPVALVRLELETLARNQLRHPKRPRPRRLLGELPPVLELLPLRR